MTCKILEIGRAYAITWKCEAVMDLLRHSELETSIKKERCLSAYFDSGEARWDHVVKVVCNPPINKIKLGKEIAKRHKVKLEKCMSSTKARDL